MTDTLLARCPACGTLNRAPAGKGGETGKCGNCGAFLGFPPARLSPMDVTDSSFGPEVMQAEMPVLVEFWSPSCGHCLRMNPVVDELAREISGRAKVAKINVLTSPRTASLYKINATPAFVLVKCGREISRILGAMPKEDLLSRLSPYL